MAEIVPVRALRYDTGKAGPLGGLIAPPYDVIDAAGRAALAARSPHNVVRLILPEGDGDARYREAARLLGAWREAGVLARDPRPSLTLYHQTFRAAGGEYTRRALLGGVRVRPYRDRVILPHERTHQGPKQDRFKLKSACRALLSPFFGLYHDPEGAVIGPIEAACDRPPDFSAEPGDGVVHRAWRCDDAGAIARAAAAMAPRTITIADGHHRYETMLALSGEIGGEAASVGLACLVRLQDPGLIVLPTHRLVHSLDGFEPGARVRAAQATFAAERRPAADAASIEAVLKDKGATAPTFAVIAPPGDHIDYLTLRADADLSGLPETLRAVDTALVERWFLDLDAPGVEKARHVRYLHETAEALRAVRASEAQAAVILNPTPVARLCAVAAAGEVMPQKSTFFVPKIPSGLLIYPFE